MGSILTFLVAPSPTLGHGADDGLAAGLDGDVLDPDHLLALAAVPVERVGQGRERAHQPVAVLQPQLAAGEGLLGQGGPAESFHGGLVGRHHLCCQHGLDDVARADIGQSAYGRSVADLLGVESFLLPPGVGLTDQGKFHASRAIGGRAGYKVMPASPTLTRASG